MFRIDNITVAAKLLQGGWFRLEHVDDAAHRISYVPHRGGASPRRTDMFAQ